MRVRVGERTRALGKQEMEEEQEQDMEHEVVMMEKVDLQSDFEIERREQLRQRKITAEGMLSKILKGRTGRRGRAGGQAQVVEWKLVAISHRFHTNFYPTSYLKQVAAGLRALLFVVCQLDDLAEVGPCSIEISCDGTCVRAERLSSRARNRHVHL